MRSDKSVGTVTNTVVSNVNDNNEDHWYRVNRLVLSGFMVLFSCRSR